MDNVVSLVPNKRIRLASLINGMDDYDERLDNMLHHLSNTSIEGYRHAKLFPYFIIAGADIFSVDDGVVNIEIDQSEEEHFYYLLGLMMKEINSLYG